MKEPQQAGEGVPLFGPGSKRAYLGQNWSLTQNARARRADGVGQWWVRPAARPVADSG